MKIKSFICFLILTFLWKIIFIHEGSATDHFLDEYSNTQQELYLSKAADNQGNPFHLICQKVQPHHSDMWIEYANYSTSFSSTVYGLAEYASDNNGRFADYPLDKYLSQANMSYDQFESFFSEENRWRKLDKFARSMSSAAVGTIDSLSKIQNSIDSEARSVFMVYALKNLTEDIIQEGGEAIFSYAMLDTEKILMCFAATISTEISRRPYVIHYGIFKNSRHVLPPYNKEYNKISMMLHGFSATVFETNFGKRFMHTTPLGKMAEIFKNTLGEDSVFVEGETNWPIIKVTENDADWEIVIDPSYLSNLGTQTITDIPDEAILYKGPPVSKLIETSGGVGSLPIYVELNALETQFSGDHIQQITF